MKLNHGIPKRYKKENKKHTGLLFSLQFSQDEGLILIHSDCEKS